MTTETCFCFFVSISTNHVQPTIALITLQPRYGCPTWLKTKWHVANLVVFSVVDTAVVDETAFDVSSVIVAVVYDTKTGVSYDRSSSHQHANAAAVAVKLLLDVVVNAFPA